MNDYYDTFDTLHAAYLHYLNPGWYLHCSDNPHSRRKAFFFNHRRACVEIIASLKSPLPSPIYDPFQFMQSYSFMERQMAKAKQAV